MTLTDRHLDQSFDPSTDLVLERVIDVPRDLVWTAWTQPEHLKQWFTPAPYTTPECEIDLRPGGRFRWTNRSPEGEEGEYVACYLDIITQERLVWTNLLGPGFRPLPLPELAFTAVISMASLGPSSTRYTATAMHPTPAIAAHHAELGFAEGWGAALDQLVDLARRG